MVYSTVLPASQASLLRPVELLAPSLKVAPAPGRSPTGQVSSEDLPPLLLRLLLPGSSTYARARGLPGRSDVFYRWRLPSTARSLSSSLRSLFTCSASSMAYGAVGRVFLAAVNCTVPFSQLIVQRRLYDAFEVVLAPGGWAAPRYHYEDYLFCDSVVYVSVRCGRLWLGVSGCFDLLILSVAKSRVGKRIQGPPSCLGEFARQARRNEDRRGSDQYTTRRRKMSAHHALTTLH